MEASSLNAGIAMRVFTARSRSLNDISLTYSATIGTVARTVLKSRLR